MAAKTYAVDDYLGGGGFQPAPGNGPAAGFYNTPFGQAIDPWGLGRNVIAPAVDSFTQPIRSGIEFFVPPTDSIIGARGLNDGQVRALAERAAALGVDPFTFGGWIDAVRNGRLDPSYIDEQLLMGEQQAAQLDTLSRTRTDVIGGLDSRIGRYDKLLSDPNAVRTDAEFGPALAEQENRFRAMADEQERNSRQMAANAGGQSLSGRAEQLASQAQFSRSRGLADIYGRTASDIRGLKTGAEDERRSAITGFGSEESAIRGAWRPSAVDPYETGFGYRAYGQGQRDQGTGRLFDTIFTGTGILTNAINGGVSNLMAFPSAVRSVKGG